MKNLTIKAKLRAKAVDAFCNRQFGCDSIRIVKAYDVATRKPVTIFTYFICDSTHTDVRVHANEMVQNFEHNAFRETREKFIKEFLVNEQKEFKAKKQEFKAKAKKQKEQKNNLGNLCPQLTGLRLA